MINQNITIKKEKQIDKLIDYCRQTGYASIDFETNGWPISHPLMVITTMAVSFQPGSSYVIPLAHKNSPFKDKWKRIFRKFGKAIIENPTIIKIAWNFKFEYNVSRKFGILFKGRLFDGMLAKYLLKEERPNDLKSSVSMFIPNYHGYDLEGQPSGDSEISRIVDFWSNVPLDKLSKYNGLDSDLTLRLMMFFESLLIKHGFYFLFRNMMMIATRVLADSEYMGMDIDKPYLDHLVVKYDELINKAENELSNNRKVKLYERKTIKKKVRKYVEEIELEIEDLKRDLIKTDDNKTISGIQRKIKSREVKLSNIKSKVFTTKKEKELLSPFNFSSPNQLIDLFFNSKYGFKFDIVKYTTDNKTKKETERPSTDEDVLLELEKKDKSGFISTLLKHRSLTKLNSTYIIGLRDKLSTENRIHSSFLLHGTVTGRLSSRNPNLQNIPRDTTASDIKKMFIPPPGYVLLQLDYSQAELRVMAAQANETEMLRWFKEGRDIHLAVACDKNGWDYDWANEILQKEDKNDPNFTLVKTQRKYAKTINFGIIYGQTARKLSEGMGTTLHEAELYLKQYAERFPNIWKHIKKQHKFVEKNGYVYNVFGRKRRLPNIYSNDWGKKAEAQRQSVNAPIQGAASDYTLFSSILIWEKTLYRKGIKFEGLTPDSKVAYINDKDIIPIDLPQAYTIHDSLGFFVRPELIHNIVPKLEAICRNPETKEWFNFQIDSVEMKVDFEVSEKSWADLGTYNPKTDYVKVLNDYTKSKTRYY